MYTHIIVIFMKEEGRKERGEKMGGDYQSSLPCSTPHEPEEGKKKEKRYPAQMVGDRFLYVLRQESSREKGGRGEE